MFSKYFIKFINNGGNLVIMGILMFTIGHPDPLNYYNCIFIHAAQVDEAVGGFINEQG